MAELIMRDLLTLNKINHIEVCSRGLSVFSQSPIAPNAKSLLSMQNIDSSCHYSKILSEDDFAQDTLILTMTHAHKDYIYNYFPKYSNQVYTLAKYVTGTHTDIQDPYSGDMDIYRQSYFEIEDLLKKLIKVVT